MNQPLAQPCEIAELEMASALGSTCSSTKLFRAQVLHSQTSCSRHASAPAPASGRGRLQVVAGGLSDWFGGENYMASKIGNKVNLETRDQPKGDGSLVKVWIQHQTTQRSSRRLRTYAYFHPPSLEGLRTWFEDEYSVATPAKKVPIPTQHDGS